MQKRVFGSLILLASALGPHAFASAPNLCHEVRCNEAQVAIQSAFDEHPGFSANVPGGAYSGSCYHVWPGLDPDHEHFGLAAVASTEQGPTFAAIFAFFPPANPYGKLSFEEAKAQLARDGSAGAPLQTSADGGYVLFESSEGTIEYWIHSDGQEFYLIGAWRLKSGRVYNWCHFTRNSAGTKR